MQNELRNKVISQEVESLVKDGKVQLGWDGNIHEYTIDYNNIMEYFSERIGETMLKVPVNLIDNSIPHTTYIVLHKNRIVQIEKRIIAKNFKSN